MRCIAFVAIGLLFLAHSAAAASWSVISFTTTPQNAPQVLAAGDKLMSSAAGKTFPGQLTFVQKLQADPAWATFLATVTKLTEPVSTVMYQTIKSWGDVQDSDTVWMTHAFNVSNPAGFLAALETFRASPTGQSFKGQVHVSAVVAGGLSPVSHVISVGYASEAEMEAWGNTRTPSKDWAAYIEASRATAEYLGGSLGRNLKTWGPAPLSDLTAP
jgi:hypothetical protein